MSSGHNELVALLKKEHDFSIKFNAFINGDNIVKLYEEFNLAWRHIDGNAYGKVVYLDLALKCIKLLPKK